MKKKTDLFRWLAIVFFCLSILWQSFSLAGSFVGMLGNGTAIRDVVLAILVGILALAFSMIFRFPIILGLFLKKKRIFLIIALVISILFGIISCGILLVTSILTITSLQWLAQQSLATVQLPSMLAAYVPSLLASFTSVFFEGMLLVALLRKKKGLPTVISAPVCFLPSVVFLASCLPIFLQFIAIRGYSQAGAFLMVYSPYSKSFFPYYTLIGSMILLFAQVFFAGTVLKTEHKRHNLICLLTGGAGVAAFTLSNLLCFGISTVSLLLYGRVYFFDGFAFTGVLWALSFLLMIVGALLIPVAALSFGKQPPQEPCEEQPLPTDDFVQPEAESAPVTEEI